MKKYSNIPEKHVSFDEDTNNCENDNYIADLTKIEEEEDQYDLYNFFPDAAF